MADNDKKVGSLEEIQAAARRMDATARSVEARVLGGEGEEGNGGDQAQRDKEALKAAFDGMASLNPVSAAAAMGMDPRDRARGEAELARMRAQDGPRLDAVKASLLEVLAKRNAEGKATNGDPGKVMAEICFDVLRESLLVWVWEGLALCALLVWLMYYTRFLCITETMKGKEGGGK